MEKMDALPATGVLRIKLSGPLNMPHADAVKQEFRRLAEHGIQRMVVDLSEVPFVDSRGLMALLHGFRLFGSDRRRFRLIRLQDQPRLLLRITGTDRLLQGSAPQL